MQVEDQIPVVDATFAQSVIPNRQALYESMLRNQLWVPIDKDPLLTVGFMKGVADGTFWMPKCEEIKFRQCADCPSKQDLVAILLDVMRGHNSDDTGFRILFERTCLEIEKRPPGIFWQLSIIATINPNHYLFAKDYVKPRVRPAERRVPAGCIPNFNGFFDGLPVSASKKKKTMTFGPSKHAREELAMQRMLE